MYTIIATLYISIYKTYAWRGSIQLANTEQGSSQNLPYTKAVYMNCKVADKQVKHSCTCYIHDYICKYLIEQTNN